MSAIFTLDQVKSPDELKVGMTVWEVHALGEQSFISEFETASLPYLHETVGSLFIHIKDKVTLFGAEVAREGTKSLYDANVVPNHYNKHKWFFTKEGAEDYLRYVKNNGIGRFC